MGQGSTDLAHTIRKINKYINEKNLITTNTKHKSNKTIPKQNITHNRQYNTTKPTLNTTLPNSINKMVYTTLSYNTHQTTNQKQNQPFHKIKIENNYLYNTQTLK